VLHTSFHFASPLNFISFSNLIVDRTPFHYFSENPTLLSRVLKRRFTMPPALNGLETRGLVDACQSDKPIHNSAERGDFTELHPEDGCHQVETSYGHESPIERAHDYENCCENV
jgi:hypothetical protein